MALPHERPAEYRLPANSESPHAALGGVVIDLQDRHHGVANKSGETGRLHVMAKNGLRLSCNLLKLVVGGGPGHDGHRLFSAYMVSGG